MKVAQPTTLPTTAPKLILGSLFDDNGMVDVFDDNCMLEDVGFIRIST
jgi:hypothetical protein